jgi:hypothetical protein
MRQFEWHFDSDGFDSDGTDGNRPVDTSDDHSD